MEHHSKISEQKAYKTRPKVEEHMSKVMDKSTLEEHLSQPLQTNKKQFRIAITILTGYNGINSVTNKKSNFFFAKSITDKDGFIQITIPQVAYEIQSLNDELLRVIFDEGYFFEAEYPFTIKPIFSTLVSIIEISGLRPLISFLPDDSLRNLLGFNGTTIYDEYILSPNPVEILSFDKIFLETNNPYSIIFRGK